MKRKKSNLTYYRESMRLLDSATFLRRDKFNSWNVGLSERFAKNIQQFSKNREALGDWNPPKTESNAYFRKSGYPYHRRKYKKHDMRRWDLFT